MFVISYSDTYCIYIPGKPGFCFHYYCASLWWVQIIWNVLAYRSYSFVCTLHHPIIIIVQTYMKTRNLSNACQIYFVACVSKIKHILSVIHYTIYGAVCFQFTHFPSYVREYTLCLIIIIKSEVWTIIHCLGLGHETMVCAVCILIFLGIVSVYVASHIHGHNEYWHR